MSAPDIVIACPQFSISCAVGANVMKYSPATEISVLNAPSIKPDPSRIIFVPFADCNAACAGAGFYNGGVCEDPTSGNPNSCCKCNPPSPCERKWGAQCGLFENSYFPGCGKSGCGKGLRCQSEHKCHCEDGMHLSIRDGYCYSTPAPAQPKPSPCPSPDDTCLFPPCKEYKCPTPDCPCPPAPTPWNDWPKTCARGHVINAVMMAALRLQALGVGLHHGWDA